MTTDPDLVPAQDYASLTGDDTVTGEAVALDLPAAGIGPRMASGLIDVVITVVLMMGVLFLTMLASTPASGALQHVALVGTLILVFLVFPTTVETLTRGLSVGKWALGLRTVRDDAGPISFQHAFVRALVGVVEIYGLSGAPAFFSVLVSSRGKRLGDYAAGTYVVRERVRLQLPFPVPMPPPLAAWAASADLATLPTPLALGARQLLARSDSLSPAARAELAQRLVQQVTPYVAPPPPPGTPPEAFLAAVLAGRRERDMARLAREDAFRRRLTAQHADGPGQGTPAVEAQTRR